MDEKYFEAPQGVINLVYDVARSYHPHLDGTSFAVIMQRNAGKSKGVPVLASINKFPEKLSPLVQDKYDFLLVVAEDKWLDLSEERRRALIDHQLCHCRIEEGPKIVAHDVEEFNKVIERHGVWNTSPGLSGLQLKLALPEEEQPRIKVGTFSEALEQTVKEALGEDVSVTVEGGLLETLEGSQA